MPIQVSVQKCFHIPQQDCSNVPVQAPVAVPVEQCYQVPRRHCQSVPVKRPKVITQNVPRQICVTSGGGGGGGGGGFGGGCDGGGGGHGCGGGSGGYGGGGGGGAGIGGFADHRKDDFKKDDHILQKRKTDVASNPIDVKTTTTAIDNNQNQNNDQKLISSKPFDNVIFVSTKPENQKFSLKDLDKFKFN